MKNCLNHTIIGDILEVSIGSVVGATELDKNEENDEVQLQAGRMTPSVQTIYGGRATATWTLNWSGTGPWKVSFSATGEPISSNQ